MRFMKKKDKPSSNLELTPEVLLKAYAMGFFPMGDSHSEEIMWHRPNPRAIIPLETFHVPSRLGRDLRQGKYTVTLNHVFQRVMEHCKLQRNDTWITYDMINHYVALHRMGFAHSLEIWMNGELAGGLYGVSIGGAFFGESKFHLQKNASKIALCELVAWMKYKGMTLLDTQYANPHIEQFGIVHISDEDYIKLLTVALTQSISFPQGFQEYQISKRLQAKEAYVQVPD